MYMLYNIGIYSSSAKEEWCFSVACRKQNKERMKWSIWAYTYYIGTNFRTQETQVNVGGWSCLYHIMKHILYWLPVLRWKETFLFLSWNNNIINDFYDSYIFSCNISQVIDYSNLQAYISNAGYMSIIYAESKMPGRNLLLRSLLAQY